MCLCYDLASWVAQGNVTADILEGGKILLYASRTEDWRGSTGSEHGFSDADIDWWLMTDNVVPQYTRNPDVVSVHNRYNTVGC
jgi:hypothetical protein